MSLAISLCCVAVDRVASDKRPYTVGSSDMVMTDQFVVCKQHTFIDAV